MYAVGEVFEFEMSRVTIISYLDRAGFKNQYGRDFGNQVTVRDINNISQKEFNIMCGSPHIVAQMVQVGFKKQEKKNPFPVMVDVLCPNCEQTFQKFIDNPEANTNKMRIIFMTGIIIGLASGVCLFTLL